MDETKDLQNNSPEQEPETPKEALPDIEIPTLRTYKGDIDRTVNKDKITTAKILIAEQKEKLKKQAIVSETSVKKPKNVFAIVFGILFLVGAVGVVGYFGYEKAIKQAPITGISQEDFFLFAFDTQKFIDSKDLKSDIDAQVNQIIIDTNDAKENTYTDIVFYKTDSITGENSRLSSAEFFNLYNINIPSDIARSISRDFVYGLYKTGIRVEPFLVVGLADYENAYDSMFDWEDRLALDMRELFPKLKQVFDNPIIPEVNTASSTIDIASSTATTTNSQIASSTATSTEKATTTPPQVNQVADRTVVFTDVVLSNRDTRAVRDPNGSPYFYYTFIDRDKILFAQDPKLITEIVRKIKEKQLVR